LQQEYDLLVLDLDLPDIDAWSVATTLCRLGLDARRLLLTSAAPTIVERNRADRLGAILLREPLVLEELVERLAQAFNGSLPAGPARDVPATDGLPSRRAGLPANDPAPPRFPGQATSGGASHGGVK
jgi:DNA-binding response OmpR family regulator